MNKECEKWEQDYKIRLNELQKELKITNDTIHPFRLKLKEFDEQIADEQRSMRSIKSRALKQEERIDELLRMVCIVRV